MIRRLGLAMLSLLAACGGTTASGGAGSGGNTSSSSGGTGGGTPDPKWGCIGHVKPPASGGMTPLKVQLVDLGSSAPVSSGLTVKLCNKLDPMCVSPLATPTADAMGFVSVTVASDFDGYLEVTDATATYLPSLVFVDLVAMAQSPTILLVSNADRLALAMAVQVTIDPNAGLLLAPSVDCTGQRTAGVSLSAAPAGAATLFYMIANTPSAAATETDTSGNAGFVNVASGGVAITATLGTGGKEMGTVTTIVRAGAMTFQPMRPTSTL